MSQEKKIEKFFWGDLTNPRRGICETNCTASFYLKGFTHEIHGENIQQNYRDLWTYLQNLLHTAPSQGKGKFGRLEGDAYQYLRAGSVTFGYRSRDSQQESMRPDDHEWISASGPSFPLPAILTHECHNKFDSNAILVKTAPYQVSQKAFLSMRGNNEIEIKMKALMQKRSVIVGYVPSELTKTLHIYKEATDNFHIDKLRTLHNGRLLSARVSFNYHTELVQQIREMRRLQAEKTIAVNTKPSFDRLDALLG